MKKLAVILVALLLTSCHKKSKIFKNKTQTEFQLVGYTPDSLEVYRLDFYDEYGTVNGHTFYVKENNKKDISEERNNK